MSAKHKAEFTCAECGGLFPPTRGQLQQSQRKHYCGPLCHRKGAAKQMLGNRNSRWKHGRKSNEAKRARAARAAEQRRVKEQAKIDAARAKVEAQAEAQEEAKQRKANLKAQILPMLGVYTVAEMAKKLCVPASRVNTVLREEGLKSNMKRGRKHDPTIPHEGTCAACGGHMALDRNQGYRAKAGLYKAVCSKECLLERQRSSGFHANNKFRPGPQHPKWVDGSGSQDATEKVLNYLIKHGNVRAGEIRAQLGKCSDSVVSRARREVGIPPLPTRKHGYYSNTAKETRNLISQIRRYIKQGANQ